MVKFICNILANRRFVLKTSDGQSSRPRQLRNGVPQGSVLSPLLFNIYISDIPLTTSRQYGYADDLALLHSDRAWSNVENTLTADMSLIAKYLRTWRLKLSMAKTTATAFHLNTKEANRQLTITLDGTPLSYNATPTYLGVKLDRQLTYKEHLKSIRAKVSSRNNLLRRLAGSKWGACATTLRTSALALVYSAAEYASPAWCRSSHAKKLDTALNDTMRLITGCLRPTPTAFLPVLSGIAPAPLRRELHTHRLVTKASSNPNNLLHDIVEGLGVSGSAATEVASPFFSPCSKAERVRLQHLSDMESKLARDPATCPTRYHAQYNCPPRREPPKEGVGVIEPDPHRSRSIQCSHAPVGAASISSLPVWRTRIDCSTHLE